MTALRMPTPAHHVIDQRDLNGPGRWAWRHELSVRLPGEPADRDTQLDPDEPRATWTETTPDPDRPAGWLLTVVLNSPDPRLTDIEQAAISGEIAEEYWRAVVG